MGADLIATPIEPNVIRREHTFSAGLSIRRLPQVSKEVIEPLRPAVAPLTFDEIANSRHWLCLDPNTQDPLPDGDQTLFSGAFNAARALQIVCPVGAKHVFVQFQVDSDKLRLKNAQVCSKLHTTLVGRAASLGDNGIAEVFDQIYAGVQGPSTKA